MRGSPARSPRSVALLVALAATVTALLWGTAVTPARAAGSVPAAAPTSSVTPSTLHFDELAPGSTESRTATLTTRAPDGAAIVRAVVTAQGPLVAHLSTLVEACHVPWTPDGCGPGAVLLLAGRVAQHLDTVLHVPVLAGVVYLRVTLTLDADAPPGSASTLTHELHLVAPDETSPPGPSGPLATTGAEAGALGSAALALVALGFALRSWVRERRRLRSAGAAS